MEFPNDTAADPVDEVLSQNDRTRIVRRSLPDGSTLVFKHAYGPDALRRLRQETAILERLASVHGVPKLAVVPPPPNGIALQDSAGTPLSRVLAQRRLEIGEVLQLSLQLTRIIGEIHRLGVIHKDINPSNILWTGSSREPVLIDFNIASSAAEERPGFVHQSEIAGTLAYMSPEQTGRTGRAVDQRADLYSLGATLYEMATGRAPFDGDDLLKMIHNHLVHVAPPAITLAPELPPMLSHIIARLMEKEPDRRYQSAEGLARDLSRLIERHERGDATPFALGERDFPRRLAPPSRLVGRDVELASLQAAFDQALQGRSQGVLVAGAPGVGKSVLINELRPMVTARRGLFVAGKFDQYRPDAASGAVTHAFRALGRLLLAEPEAEMLELRTQLLAALGSNAGLMAATLPEFQLLLGVPPHISVDDPLQSGQRLVQASIELLRVVASAARPVVMVLDDLQWSAATSIKFIDAVLTDPHLPGVLLVGAYREEEVDEAHPLTPMLERWDRLETAPLYIQLRNLAPLDLSALLEEMLRLQPAEASKLGRVLGARTGGNPFDTVELVNALRRDGALALSDDGWTWDAAMIRRYVGHGEVVDLLAARVAGLPAKSRELLGVLACLGGEVELGLLRVASGSSILALEAHLQPALEEGLLVMDQGTQQAGGGAVRFRHDRVQQAAYGMLEPAVRTALHLTLARRLAAVPNFAATAAEQYLPAVDAVDDEQERRRVVEIFRSLAVQARVSNFAVAERFLAAAIQVLGRIETADDNALFIELQTARHAALFGLARLDEADTLYESIQARCSDPLQALDATGMQMFSLSNRARQQDAMALGLQMLQRLGQPMPADLDAAIESGLNELIAWISSDAKDADLERDEVSDPRVIALAKMLVKTGNVAFFCNPKVLSWSVLATQRLWVEHGPSREMLACMSASPNMLIGLKQDYQAAYTISRHVVKLGERLGNDAQARYQLALYASQWFEPVEESVSQFRRARETMLQAGDVRFAAFTYLAIDGIFDSSPTLEGCITEVDAAFAFSARTANHMFMKMHAPRRQLMRALTGQTRAPGSFEDDTFDEAAHLESLAPGSTGRAYLHILRGLSALLFGDIPTLITHAQAAMPMLWSAIPGFYMTAWAHCMQALALAERMHAAPPGERAALLVEFDLCRDWLARRAADAPANFLHLLRLIEAERAWVVGHAWAATAGYSAALKEVSRRMRPWHRALIAERAGVFHLRQGMEPMARLLLSEARDLYDAWGASAKVREMAHTYPVLRGGGQRRAVQGETTGRSTIVSTDAVDMAAILRASQVLSSETSLARLKTRVGELLGAITGASSVTLALRRDDTQEWFLPQGEDAAQDGPLSIEQAGARGLVPLSAFRYALRTRESVLVEDATQDDRFAADPYFAALPHCSLLAVPILNKGEPRALLLLENRAARGAFATERLDSVMLIAGQLAVSLDNALLYASLEQKVAQRTEALEAANRQLAQLSLTDALTGLPNRRRFNEMLDAEWIRGLRTQTPIGLVMIDIDQFKLYNDHYGHLGGDTCLKLVGNAMKGGLCRATDLAARYGGEEFVLVLPGTDLEGTYQVAERVRLAVAALQEPHALSTHGIVTISMGVTSFIPSDKTSIAHQMEVADAALYGAKTAGRNRVGGWPV